MAHDIEVSEDIGLPSGFSIQSERAKKIAALAEKQAVKNPPDYFELSGRNPSLPQRYKAKGFSDKSTLDDHYKRHAEGVGATSKEDYVNKAIEFIHSPLGKKGELFVTSQGKIFRYNTSSRELAIAYMDNHGTIGTYKNLGAEKGTQGADKFWTTRKGKLKGV